MKLCKFGGTSLASAEQIKKVANIVLSDPDRRVVVVSAPGKRDREDTKVTDLLIDVAEQYNREGKADTELQRVLSRFREITEGLALSEDVFSLIESDLQERLKTDVDQPEQLVDLMKAAGEDNNAKIVAAYLNQQGTKAKYVNPLDGGLLLSDEYGNARVLEESYERLQCLREQEEIIVFPGFFGFTPEGKLVTFPRGGSDITGSILAAALKVDLYENFTDVDSVYAVNPALVDQPHEIRTLTYQEMRELSYAGFSVLHDEALVPAFRAGVPVCIKNTNNPQAPGTMIVSQRDITIDPVVGIAGDSGFCTIYLSKYLMNREIGFGRKLLQILEDEQLSYEHTPSGIDHISVVLREDQLTEDKEARILRRIREELQVDNVEIERRLSLIMIVGEGMNDTVGIASKATKALAEVDVNIEMINQGSSEVSMMFGVKEEDEKRAVQALYKEFFHA